MSTAILPKLTPRDFAILETMLADHLGEDEFLIAAIRKKLEFAQIVFADDIADDIATIGSRVAFGIDGGIRQERRLVTIEHYVPAQGHQTMASLRGVGLLGLSAGDRLTIDYGDRQEQLMLHQVLYQPEAESRMPKKSGGLHLVSEQRGNRDSRGHRSISEPAGDDPGPSAA